MPKTLSRLDAATDCTRDPFDFAQGRLFLRLKNGIVRMTQSEWR
jgi:hypothetical protein